MDLVQSHTTTMPEEKKASMPAHYAISFLVQGSPQGISKVGTKGVSEFCGWGEVFTPLKLNPDSAFLFSPLTQSNHCTLMDDCATAFCSYMYICYCWCSPIYGLILMNTRRTYLPRSSVTITSYPQVVQCVACSIAKMGKAHQTTVKNKRKKWVY